MRIDKVEEIWSDLEASYKKSKSKSRRQFVQELTAFDGSKGAVQPLISFLKDDLDDSSEAITRYSALCRMLEDAEEWLLCNEVEIPDLNDWIQRLGGLRQFNIKRIKTTYEPSTDQSLIDSIKTGYVLPGMYDKMPTHTFPAMLDGYVYFNSAVDVSLKLPKILGRIHEPGNTFSRHVAHILQECVTERTLETPCVFVSSELLRAPIVKYHKQKSVRVRGVPIISSSSMLMDLDYDIGTVAVSVATSVPVYVIKQ